MTGASGTRPGDGKTTVLLTRPREDSEDLAARLAERGLGCLIDPLLSIDPVADAVIDTEGVQGFLITSANGIRALAQRCDRRDLPVWTVGDASARAATALGYQQVHSAAGDVDTLADLVIQRCSPTAGTLVHAAGSVTAGDLAGRLGQAGFTLRRQMLYQARVAESLSPACIEALRAGTIDMALFFSPRTAATFVRLVTAAGLGGTTGRVTVYALSAAVAAKLDALSWAALRVAATPTQAALLAAMDGDLASGVAAADPRTRMSQTDEPTPIPSTEQPDTAPEAPKAIESDAAPTESPTTEAPIQRRSWVRWVVLAVLLVILIAAGLAASVWWEWHRVAQNHTNAPRVETLATVEDLDQLRADLAGARAQIRQMQDHLTTVPTGTSADLTPLQNRLDQTEAGLHALQAQPQVPAKLVDDVAALDRQVTELRRTSADAAAVLRLSDRLEKVESALRDLQARRSSAAAMLLAVGQLREAVANALPFDAELRAAKALAGPDPEIVATLEGLKPRAVVGIASRAMLTARLAVQAPAIVRAQILPEQQSWWRQTLARMASLVTVERDDGAAAGTGPAAVLARAQAALLQSDLATAVAEIATLTGGPAEQAAPWLAEAKARLAAEEAINDLTAHVIAAVGAGQ